ncbi:1,6-anhydro-N-acetylmuramyl-L-alanine amidase AmpD [Ottowia thiooxydans]|uniref:1,6-anhydro-N-acetylmuramyl-L-alanine amidase AmpD n=1 Tax=Ottowia thiooxydans TaxID=219182 RepID=A0ABV2QDT4_9BURK
MPTKPPESLPATDTGKSLWDQGWYRHARRLDSPNFGPRPVGTEVDLIVVHSISLPPGRFEGDYVQALFTNQLNWEEDPYFQGIRGLEVSAHFYVRRDGALWQFVSCSDRAWHAGASCHQGRSNCNDFSVGIELEGLEGGVFEPAQYETLSSLCAAIAGHYPISAISGHEHIAPGRKQDPGVGFDWDELRNNLGWSEERFPAS